MIDATGGVWYTAPWEWTGTNSTVIYGDNVWGNWQTIYTANITTTANTVSYSLAPWNWVEARDFANHANHYVRQLQEDQHRRDWAKWNTVHVETEEARQRRLAEEEIRMVRLQHEVIAARARREQDEKQRAEARLRARELLMLHLSAEQKKDVLSKGSFIVVSNLGRRWRIRLDGIGGNVDLLPDEGDVRLASYCVHPVTHLGLPNHDHHLAQKFDLETDEKAFTDIAYLHYQDRERLAEIPQPDSTARIRADREAERMRREEYAARRAA